MPCGFDAGQGGAGVCEGRCRVSGQQVRAGVPPELPRLLRSGDDRKAVGRRLDDLERNASAEEARSHEDSRLFVQRLQVVDPLKEPHARIGALGDQLLARFTGHEEEGARSIVRGSETRPSIAVGGAPSRAPE